MGIDYYYDDYDDYPDYDGDYDFRTYNEKVYDDNTWQKNRGVLTFDGVPYLMWCTVCQAEVQVEMIEGSTVFDSYAYFICHECGADENKLEESDKDREAND